MFRSVSEDGATGSQPFGAGRRRTRAQAALEVNERREQLKRTRAVMEAMGAAKRSKKGSPDRRAQSDKAADGVRTPPRVSTRVVVVGASFGENLAVEHTPTKQELQSPPQVRRVGLPSPEKSAPLTSEKQQPPQLADAVRTRRALAVRGIAQSSSSASTRKRMISFSPERAERPVNEELARQKLQRNLKATEKLQLRLEGVTVKTPEKTVAGQRTSPASTGVGIGGASSAVVVVPSPIPVAPRSETPLSQPSESLTMELASPNDHRAHAPSCSAGGSDGAASSCKKELDFAAVDAVIAGVNEGEQVTAPALSQSDEVAASPELDQLSKLSASQESNDSEKNDGPQHSIGFEASQDEGMPFTSTSLIEDVGLFNCDTDVEYTGGVYGEGTDGKVSAAMVRGQKVALKKAKPHEGFPEEEAKRRSAVELHYLRKVRHVEGFVQCLGLCDGIEHTCIALEVMDCKLSDYLRRFGKNQSKSKRRFTLPLDATKSMLKQICRPMVVLHEQVNVAHGDLACRNILLRTPPTGYEQKWEPVVKLSDFGRIKTPSSEPNIFDEGFSFNKNADVGSFAREILYRLLVGEIVPTNCTETRNLHKLLQDVVVTKVPESAKERLGPYYRLFMRCSGWGVRPTFREIVDHLDDLEFFETSENGLFPLKPAGAPVTPAACDVSFMSPFVEGGRAKMPSSGSKGNKYETPSTAAGRAPTGPRLLPSKSFTETGGSSKLAPKAVNWLKARSVHPGQQQVNKIHPRTALSIGAPKPIPVAVSTTLASTQVATTTPIGRPALHKKTPPSAGASRRSLQILNQIQHRQHQKEKKNV